jgi:hypothetical protein
MPSSSVSNSPKNIAGLPTTPTKNLATNGVLREAQVSVLSFILPKRRTERSSGLGVMRTCNWDRAFANEFPVLFFGLEVSIMRTCTASGSISFGECGKEVVLCGCWWWGSGTVDGEWRWWIFRLIDNKFVAIWNIKFTLFWDVRSCGLVDTYLLIHRLQNLISERQVQIISTVQRKLNNLHSKFKWLCLN